MSHDKIGIDTTKWFRAPASTCARGGDWWKGKIPFKGVECIPFFAWNHLVYYGIRAWHCVFPAEPNPFETLPYITKNDFSAKANVIIAHRLEHVRHHIQLMLGATGCACDWGDLLEDSDENPIDPDHECAAFPTKKYFDGGNCAVQACFADFVCMRRALECILANCCCHILPEISYTGGSDPFLFNVPPATVATLYSVWWPFNKTGKYQAEYLELEAGREYLLCLYSGSSEMGIDLDVLTSTPGGSPATPVTFPVSHYLSYTLQYADDSDTILMESPLTFMTVTGTGYSTAAQCNITSRIHSSKSFDSSWAPRGIICTAQQSGRASKIRIKSMNIVSGNFVSDGRMFIKSGGIGLYHPYILAGSVRLDRCEPAEEADVPAISWSGPVANPVTATPWAALSNPLTIYSGVTGPFQPGRLESLGSFLVRYTFTVAAPAPKFDYRPWIRTWLELTDSGETFSSRILMRHSENNTFSAAGGTAAVQTIFVPNKLGAYIQSPIWAGISNVATKIRAVADVSGLGVAPPVTVTIDTNDMNIQLIQRGVAW